MRRNILVAFVAAIALAIGFNTAATAAVEGGAQATAKKKAGKKKAAGCKAKGKKKADKSASAAAKKKKKAAKCKAKPKKKKGTAKGTALSDGVYRDAAKSVTVTVSGGGKQAQVQFVASRCAGGLTMQVKGPIGPSPVGVKSSGEERLFGGAGNLKWTLIVTPSNLAYQFNTVWAVVFPDQNPCQDMQSLRGTLKK